MGQQNIDTACFYLIVNYDDLDTAIQREVDVLRENLRFTLISNQNLQKAIDESLSRIFTLRIMALKTLSKQDKEYEDLFKEAYSYFENLLAAKKIDGIAENILFALRSNMRVSKAFFENIPADKVEEQIKAFPDNLTYEDFLGALTINSPSPEVTSILQDWTKSSLTIEYVIVACALVNEEKLDISSVMLDELSTIVADATHLYNAIAFESRLLKVHPFQTQNMGESEQINNTETIGEEQKLADAGLKSFAEIWRKND